MRYADPDLSSQTNPGCLTPAALNKVHHVIRQYLEDKNVLGEWFGRFITAPKYPDEEQTTQTFQLRDLRAHIEAGGMLQRNEGSRMAFHERDDELWLFADGHQFQCHEDQADLVKVLCAELTIHPGTYRQSEAHLQLLLALLNQNSLYMTA